MTTRYAAAGARVHARGWSWRHAGRAAPAVSDLDLDISPGERVLLLGPSGAGKSTLLQALAGVLGGEEEGDESGSITIDGRHPLDARGRAGLMLQDPESQVVLARLGDDVAFSCENLGVPRDETWRRVREALGAVRLELPLDHPTSALSGGQKQRLALAGILAMRPGLILLDEPTANLDPAGVEEVRAAVDRAVAETGATLIVVEHRVAVWRDMVDRVIVVDPAGGLLADGAPETVLSGQADVLSAAGVWVPGVAPVLGDRPRRGMARTDVLMSADGLSIGRTAFGSRTAVTVRSGLDVEVRAGTGTALVGPNGSGKSTLALTLAGLLAPVAGRVRSGEALAGARGDDPARWRSRELLTRVGMVFQEPEHQFITGTVRGELLVGPRALRLPEAEAAERVDELLARLRLQHLADANPFTLSGGEKRRLSVATALATRPRLLILDEPTFGQDARTWREMVELMGSLIDDGNGVVVVTHDAELIAAMADEVVDVAVAGVGVAS